VVAETELATAPRASGTARRRTRMTEARWAFVMLAPTALGLGVFYLWPVVQTLYYSFTVWTGFGSHHWAGFANYIRLLHDPELGGALRHTFIYSALVLLGVPLAIVLAALLNQPRMRGRSLYRVLYFLPVVTMPIAAALMWRLLYNGDFGLINAALKVFGIHGLSWTSDARVALYALVVVGIWQVLGYNLVILLGGLQAIPRELYEAAALDGAGPVRAFLRITVPLLSPSVFFVSVISVITTLQMFDLVYAMIGATNPALPNTRTIVYLFYNYGFVEGDRGYASAIVFLLLAIILALTALQFRLQRRWVHYG
jgi:multiple sugar transport system permease protein